MWIAWLVAVGQRVQVVQGGVQRGGEDGQLGDALLSLVQTRSDPGP